MQIYFDSFINILFNLLYFFVNNNTYFIFSGKDIIPTYDIEHFISTDNRFNWKSLFIDTETTAVVLYRYILIAHTGIKGGIGLYARYTEKGSKSSTIYEHYCKKSYKIWISGIFNLYICMFGIIINQ